MASIATGRVPEHGTRSRYVLGCHCAACTEANADYSWAYRLRRGIVRATRHRCLDPACIRARHDTRIRHDKRRVA
jgi:hypothetical protein